MTPRTWSFPDDGQIAAGVRARDATHLQQWFDRLADDAWRPLSKHGLWMTHVVCAHLRQLMGWTASKHESVARCAVVHGDCGGDACYERFLDLDAAVAWVARHSTLNAASVVRPMMLRAADARQRLAQERDWQQRADAPTLAAHRPFVPFQWLCDSADSSGAQPTNSGEWKHTRVCGRRGTTSAVAVTRWRRLPPLKSCGRGEGGGQSPTAVVNAIKTRDRENGAHYGLLAFAGLAGAVGLLSFFCGAGPQGAKPAT